jgi:hypothetical protein
MITNMKLNNITATFADQLQVSGSVVEPVVHQVSQGVLKSLPVR